MAGTWQHHIWQMIQRGFGTKRGKHFHVWVYEKDADPKRTSTQKHGAQEHFLSVDGDNSADDTLTNFENKTQSKIQEIRKLTDKTKISPETIAPIVSHLEMRSLYLREELTRLGRQLIDEFSQTIRSKHQISKMMLNYIKENPDYIENEFGKRGLDNQQKLTAQSIVDLGLKDFLDKNHETLSIRFLDSLAPLLGEMSGISKSAQIKSIKGGFSDIERTEKHRSFSYIVRKTESQIILPDTGLAFLGKNRIAPFSQKDDSFSDVIVPLSADTYVHGYKKSYIARSEDTLCKILSSCAFKTFVACQRDDKFIRLTKNIGRKTNLLNEREIKTLVRGQ